MGKYSFLATASLMINVVSFTSLILSIYKTHNTSSFNWPYLLGNYVGQAMFITYGIVNKAPEIWIPTSFLLAGLTYIIYIKWFKIPRTD